MGRGDRVRERVISPGWPEKDSLKGETYDLYRIALVFFLPRTAITMTCARAATTTTTSSTNITTPL